MKRYLILMSLIVAIVFQLSSVIAEDDKFLVIANAKVSQNSIKISELQKAYLGKSSSFAGGQKIVPVTLETGPAHEAFLKKCIRKTSSQFSTYWKQAIFTGQGIPPKSFKGEDEIIAFVSQTEDAVGYISSNTAYSGVKVLALE